MTEWPSMLWNDDRVPDYEPVGLVTIAVRGYTILVATQPLAGLTDYVAHGRVVEEFPAIDDRSSIGYSFVGVTRGGDWPQLVVTQRFSPAGRGFAPGVLVVPETGAVFIGAGTRLLGYRLDPDGDWQRVFVDEADFGFWAWQQHGDVVVMSAELELAAWTTTCAKLWSMFVEPPWSYQVRGEEIQLDVMGTLTTFNLSAGPTGRHQTVLLSVDEAKRTIEQRTASGAIVLGFEGFWTSGDVIRPDPNYIADLSGTKMEPDRCGQAACQILDGWPRTDDFRVEVVFYL